MDSPENPIQGRSLILQELQRSGPVLVDRAAVQAWGELFRADPNAHLQQHPEYAALDLNRPGPAASLPGLWLGHWDRGDITAAAILLPKVLPLWGAAKFVTRNWTGYRLAGNRCLRMATATADFAWKESLIELAAREVRKRGADFLLAEDLDDDSPLRKVLLALKGEGWRAFSPTGLQPRLRIRIPSQAAEYWSQFSSKTRYNLKRTMKRLGGTLFRATTEADVPRFLELSHQVSLTTWQTRSLGLRIHNSDFERRLNELAAREQALRSFVLIKDDRPVAFVVGIQFRGTFWLEEIGYDPAFAEFSPGMAVILHALDDLFLHNTPEWFDFGGGDAPYKQTLANTFGHSGSLLMVPPGVRRTAVLHLLDGSRHVRIWGRELLSQTGLIGRARHWLRHAVSPVPRNPTPRTHNPEAAAPAREAEPVAPGDRS